MRFRFASCELDLARHEFRHGGALRPLEPQVFQLLAHLVQHRERVVSKDELVETVWEGRIVSDAAIHSRVSAARDAVGDDGKRQAVIRTVPRLGFRIVADVTIDDTPDALPTMRAVAAASGTPSATAPAPTVTRRLPLPAKPTVAVLPFANISGQEDQAYLADGIAHDLITALSKNRWLLVLAWNATVAFRNPQVSIRELAAEIDADYLVTGGVRRDGGRMRVNVQLIEGESGAHLWAEKFDHEMTGIFELQDEIATNVAANIGLELELAEQQRVTRKPPQNLDAWDNYLLGLKHFHTFSADGHAKAQVYLTRALELDPDFALAHATLAFCIVLSTVYFDVEANDAVLARALAMAERAVDLDGQDAMTRFALGRAHLARGEYPDALRELRASIDLNPCTPVVRCGLADALTCSGQLDEGLEQFELAVQLGAHDPWRWGIFSYRSLTHLFRGEYDAAANWASQATRFPNAHFWADANLAAALGHLDQPHQAQAVVEGLLKRKPEFTCEYPRQHLTHVRNPTQLDVVVTGLRNAGVPESSAASRRSGLA